MSRIGYSALRPLTPPFNVDRETSMPVAKYVSLKRPPWLHSGIPGNIELGVRGAALSMLTRNCFIVTLAKLLPSTVTQTNPR